LKKYDFDFVIGSVHVINGYDPYYEDFYRNINVRDAYRAYFDQVLENIRAFDEYDTLGHLDYVVRYGLKYFGSPAADCPFEDYKEQIDAILRHLIMHGKSLEVNTGAFRYSMSEPNPSYQILQYYYDIGGRDITLGADAHEPKDVAIAYEKVVPELRSIGFEYFNVYMDRIPRRVLL
ncbi:MAG: histidinol-phosphatase HisJ family protein, partial [Lachnospiraceae bacterium]|nr:histidinol-phosphatase HisJ family protein [Lachnospiraceae bacterium]